MCVGPRRVDLRMLPIYLTFYSKVKRRGLQKFQLGSWTYLQIATVSGLYRALNRLLMNTTKAKSIWAKISSYAIGLETKPRKGPAWVLIQQVA